MALPEEMGDVALSFCPCVQMGNMDCIIDSPTIDLTSDDVASDYRIG